MTSTIEVSGLHKRFRSVNAVDGIDLEIGPGVTGFLGPNGAGKTTLLRMLATVLAPDQGTLSILGLDPLQSDDREAIRRRLGYLPQEPGFHRSFSSFAFVDYIAVLKGLVDKRSRHDEVRRVLTLVGLEAVMNKPIRSLSGGMRRRVGIAQALLADPDLLIFDEPTAGLDPEQRLRFRELLSSPASDRIVVLSTHQTDDVAALCQRVIVMYGGSVRFDGPPQGLADVADGRVWLAGERDPRASLAWVTSEGVVRHIGEPPAGADLVEPTIGDGYLVLVGRTDDAGHEAVA
jgi:ABC-2 type transport system ATP-binding protein